MAVVNVRTTGPGGPGHSTLCSAPPWLSSWISLIQGKATEAPRWNVAWGGGQARDSGD